MSALDLQGALARIKRLLAGFTTGQKAVTAVAVVALLLGGFLFSKWASKPTYAPAFTNLSATDASAITQKLTENKTPYQLADGGATVEVPQSQVYAVRIALAGAGLPASDQSGYSLLDKQGLTTSDFQQHVTYQRALEGELQKTIEAISGVQAAIVHLAIPQQDVFTADNTKPSASVLVRTDPGTTLTAQQVQSVVHLVSSAVEGLTPDAVTVADANGQVLNAPGTAGASAVSDLQMAQTKSYQDATASAVQTMLDSVVGPGHAVVRVQADLNFDQQQTDSEQYVTDKNAVPLQQSTSKETYNGAGTAVGGVLGPDNSGVPTGSGGNTTYTKTQDDHTNAVGKITQQTTSAPGQVRRQSVAVILDAKTAGAVNPADINKLVAAAAGIVPSRGDTVQVSTMSFDTSSAAQAKKELDAAAAANKRSALMSMVKTGAIVLLVLGIVFFLFRRARKVERIPLDLTPFPAELTVGDLPELEAADFPPLIESHKPLAIDPAKEEAERARTAIRSDIVTMIDEQPDEMARLLRGWLADRRS